MDIGFCISHTRLDKSHYIRCNQFKLDDSFGTAAYYRGRRKSANKPCVRTACYKLSTSLEQAFNNLQQPC